ncbi:amino acid ABC transporter substrate-binding protein (PAAT family) [Crenobacter luteus]|uniref:ABC transporter substrate-binding protein n=1 Tax=Crenobacter luteus TaxID=1452487 RepID=A0A161SD53_9NEIS|nr:basic amino acid ABC transporter substrate-binding protein [Crenobacter luteus]KZE34193.1 ABC transporter substrate-binding protein [Crenobacter luteus]TCP11193.1 amino acid ABC transporter substrate-binding protein (PAAT family) [Crenobacter luteus]
MILQKKWVLAGVVAAALAVTACSKKEEAPAAGAAGEAREYIVGSDAAYAPFEFQNDKNEVVGFSVEVLSAVAEKGGFKVRFLNTPWEGIFATLDQGDRDIISSSVTITDQRKQSMDFSEPYFEARQLIAVGKGVGDVKSFQDLKNKKVSVQTGTTGDEVVQKLLGKTSPNIKRFESMPLALKELESGGVQASVGDNGVVINYVKNNPGSGIVTVEDAQTFAPEFYGFAVKKGNTELLEKINKGLAAIKADGTYDQIYKKYFGN